MRRLAKHLVPALASLALAGPGLAESRLAEPRPAAPLPVHIAGRVLPLAGGGYAFGWPGVYFESRFRGEAVTVAADSATEHLAVLVDGVERARLTRPGAARLTLSGLGPGEHTVRLQKLTESQTGGGRFLGFFAGPGATPLPPPARQRQIEFIGDSYTVGYGDTSASRACTADEIHDTTDTRRAFGPLLAARLDADDQVNAWSGFGVVRNYDGRKPDLSLPAVYPRLIPDDPSHLDAGSPAWRPQLVVIGLGTNDFSTPLHPGERWPDQAALRADYRATYVRFARAILDRPERPHLILMAHADWAAEVEAVAHQLDPTGQRVRVLAFQGLELGACDYHPSLADHRRLADELGHMVADFGPQLWRR